MNDTKEAILRTALRLFSQSGYEAVSVRDIAGALGVTPGALYKHYATKQAIFESILSRMEQNDREHAREYGLPEEDCGAAPSAYGKASLKSVAEFALAQFRYWTEDEFASAFRRMLTIEQYREPRLSALYRGYLSSGPLKYTADIFRAAGAAESDVLAMELYAPLYLLISCRDESNGNTPALKAAQEHVAKFIEKHENEIRSDII